MTPEERQALREKHQPHTEEYEADCGSCWNVHPCDVIKVLDELDRVTERDIESKILAVIHAYDETPESKLARIWKILGEKA